MNILVIAEHDNQSIKSTTLNTLTAAQQLKGNITVLIAGYQCDSLAKQIAHIDGIARIIVADSSCYAHGLAENLASLVVQLAPEFNYLIAPATTYGKNVMPRVAALLDVAQISDVVKIISADTFVRPMYAGNAFASIQSTDLIKVITIRCTTFSAATSTGSNQARIETCDIAIDTQLTCLVKYESSKSARPELAAARVVIAGGRALQSAENFKLLEELADRLDAAIGASRAAVDAGFVPNDYQVGQTGKVVAPELYIAVGISGAIQHLAGIKDSKVIVAINKDPDAPIFQVANYGLVGDLFEIIPQLNAELDKLKN